MKKILITLLLLAVPSMTLAFDVNLKQGSRGEEVKKVQKFLGVEETGYFGVLTKKAVIAFQKEKGLPAFGFWYGMTRAEAKKGVEQVATSTPAVVSSTVVVASSTVKEHVIDWNFKTFITDKNYYSKNAEILFTPTWRDTGTLARVTRCEYSSDLKTTSEGGSHVIQYDNSGKVRFSPIVWKDYTTKFNCVAFDFVDGKYTEYKSPVIEIK